MSGSLFLAFWFGLEAAFLAEVAHACPVSPSARIVAASSIVLLAVAIACFTAARLA